MASPACTVKDGGGAANPTTNGNNVTPGNTITVALASTAGVSAWSISCVYTDDLSNAVTVTSALSIDNLNKLATFTAPAAGAALIFQSKINGGIDANGAAQPSLTTTFGIYTLTSGALRTVAANETTEGNATFGWAAAANAKIRQAAGGGSTLPVNRPAVEKTASYTLVSTTDHLVTFTGAGPWTATMPATPAAGDEYVLANETASNLTVAGNGNSFLVAGSSTIAPGAAVTFVKSTTANWIAS